MGTILRPIRILIRICGWTLDRPVDPIKIGCTGSPTLLPRTCRRPVVSQPLGAPNQYRAPNLRSSWPCSNTRLISPKMQPPNSGVYTKSEHEQLRQMVLNMASQSGDTCAPPYFWLYNNQPSPPPLAPPLC